MPPNREYNTHNGFLLPFTPNVTFTLDIMRHPVWFTKVLMKYFTTIGMPRNENYPDEYKRMQPQRSEHRPDDAAGFAELGRHQDLPREVAGNPDGQRASTGRRMR